MDTSLFVKKPYLGTNYKQSNIEEDIDLKNQYRIKSLPGPTEIQDTCSKNYVNNLFNDPSIIKNSEHIDLNDRNITNARFIQLNQLPQVDSHLTAKLYVDNAIFDTKNYVDNKFNDPSIIKNTDHVDFNAKDLDKVGWTKVNKMPAIEEHLTPKLYVENFIKDIKSVIVNLHELNRNRRDLSSVFNDQDNEFDDNKLTNLDSITVSRNPNLYNELANKK